MFCKSVGCSYGFAVVQLLPIPNPSLREGSRDFADLGSVVTQTECFANLPMYMLPECFAYRTAVVTACSVMEENLLTLRIVYTLLRRCINPLVVVTAYAVIQIIPSL